MTGMPACMALRATGVSAAPSKGSRTMASTPSLMKVSTWLIWVLTSLVPSATWSSTSSYLSGAALPALVMPAIQPWSAAGAENPMVTVSPDSSLSLAALLPPPPPELSGVFPVQPARRTPAPMNATAVDVTRRYPRCLDADNGLSSLCLPGAVARWSVLPFGGASGWPGGPPGGADPRAGQVVGSPAPPGRAPAGAPGTALPPPAAPPGPPGADTAGSAVPDLERRVRP